MNNPQTNGFFQKYKELIVTTIICLFLTGIYDSINNQTAEIKKWYELMIGINEKVKVQADNLHRLEKSLETHVQHADERFNDHNQRIRSIEFKTIPRGIHRYKSLIKEDTSHVEDTKTNY
jgi:predicted  nucleic acid-binding Zn-ribbon protein